MLRDVKRVGRVYLEFFPSTDQLQLMVTTSTGKLVDTVLTAREWAEIVLFLRSRLEELVEQRCCAICKHRNFAFEDCGEKREINSKECLENGKPHFVPFWKEG